MMPKTRNNTPPKKDREILNHTPPNDLSILEGLRVLIVDDNEDSVILTSFILEEYAIEVITALSANEGLKLFLQMKPDILICDLAMPGEDGYSLIKKIRKLETSLNRQIPAIALTASARNEDNILSIEAGFQIHLKKPIEPTELVEIVATLAKQFHK